MNKDVIYIDVEDDITAIIGKVKASKEKIVALVPPKRIGVLQSAVNLRLLTRAAEQAGKRIVLITNNQALVALSAAASIPVAKNLQSKPEIAEISALEIDDGEDVIDGSQLPVGELANAIGTPKEDVPSKADALVSGIDLSDEPAAAAAAAKTPKKTPGSNKKAAGKKVPNFNIFRKKLLLIILAALLLIGGLIWALVFAPAATVIISARTSPVSINDVVRIGENNNIADGVIKGTVETIEREAEVEFEATGEREVGERATGSVRFFSNDAAALLQGIDIPAGTILTAQGREFTTDTSVRLSIPGNRDATVSVTARERGASSNGVSGSVSGAPSGVDQASFVNATSGGTDRTVTVVTAADVQAASEKLVDQSTDEIEQELRRAFSDDVIIVEDSFVADRASASSNPAVGQEAENGRATLTSKVTYRLTGVAKSDLEQYVTEVLESQMEDQTTRKVYGTGVDEATFTDYTRENNTASVRLSVTGQVGPEIDEDEVKEEVAGKRYGDIQSSLEQIDGVNDVEVRFSFFWVRTVPNNLDKITIEFKLQDAEE